MCGATFNLVTPVGLLLFFGTLKDGDLQINILALNNNFRCRNVFQNGIRVLSIMVVKNKNKNKKFGQKAQNFV